MVKVRHHTLLDALRTEDKRLDINYYTLIFDAFRILPEFKKRFEQYKSDRLDTWIRVIAGARKSGEINSDMPDGDLARIFVYLNQGVGMSFIMGNNLRQKYREIGQLWGHLYDMLKA